MKLYAHLKLFFKNLKSNFILNLVYFLVLPLTLSGFFGLIEKSYFENPINTEVYPIIISDNDNSIMSKDLIDFFENNLKDIIHIVGNKEDRDDADLEIIIPENYEESVLSKSKNNIVLKILNHKSSIASLLEDILNDYHEKLYLSSSNNSNDLNEIFNKTSLKTSIIESNVNQNSYEYFAITMLGFLSIMFIMNNVVVEYLGESNGQSKRLLSMPISRVKYLYYNCAVSWIHSFIFIMLYVIVYRALGIAFKGNILLLILLCGATSLLLCTSTNFISTFFSKKLGQILVSILVVLQMLFGGIFSPLGDIISKFTKLSPLYLVNEMYTKYSIYNTFESIKASLSICILLSLVLFVSSGIKEKYHWREF